MSKTPVTILIEKNIAEEIQQKGLAEIALRQKDAKFKAMIKCALESNTLKKDDKMSRVLNCALNQVSNNTRQLEKVNHSIRYLGNSIDMLDGHIISVADG